MKSFAFLPTSVLQHFLMFDMTMLVVMRKQQSSFTHACVMSITLTFLKVSAFAVHINAMEIRFQMFSTLGGMCSKINFTCCHLISQKYY